MWPMVQGLQQPGAHCLSVPGAATAGKKKSQFLIRKWCVIYSGLVQCEILTSWDCCFRIILPATFSSSPYRVLPASSSDKKQKSFVRVLIRTSRAVCVFLSFFLSCYFLNNNIVSSLQPAVLNAPVWTPAYLSGSKFCLKGIKRSLQKLEKETTRIAVRDCFCMKGCGWHRLNISPQQHKPTAFSPAPSTTYCCSNLRPKWEVPNPWEGKDDTDAKCINKFPEEMWGRDSLKTHKSLVGLKRRQTYIHLGWFQPELPHREAWSPLEWQNLRYRGMTELLRLEKTSKVT